MINWSLIEGNYNLVGNNSFFCQNFSIKNDHNVYLVGLNRSLGDESWRLNMSWDPKVVATDENQLVYQTDFAP